MDAIDQSLLLAAYFRGNLLSDDRWISCNDQVVALSLFCTGDISQDECCEAFARRSGTYGWSLCANQLDLRSDVNSRYRRLIELTQKRVDLIEGGGDLVQPAWPTFTACRLTVAGEAEALSAVELYPSKPDFPNWPDRRTLPE